MIVMKGDVEDTQALKSVLHNFSKATGLRINYTKSTMVPVHLDQETAAQCAVILGCCNILKFAPFKIDKTNLVLSFYAHENIRKIIFFIKLKFNIIRLSNMVVHTC